MATQTKLLSKVGDALPPGVKQALLNTLFGAYGQLAKTRAPYETIFILSHMRSGSSLLATILGNSSEICGYGESMLSYHSARDLELLAGSNLYRLQPWRRPGDERYMLDKLVHDDLLAPDTLPLLAERGCLFIFLMREAAGTIRSMMSMADMNDTLAASLYVKRLDMLEQYGRMLPDVGSAFLLSYDDLVRRTEKTLAGLSSYLDLQTPLSATYEVLRPMAGKNARHYDKLHLGHVDGDGSASSEVEISQRNLNVADSAHGRCWAALSEVSVMVPD